MKKIHLILLAAVFHLTLSAENRSAAANFVQASLESAKEGKKLVIEFDPEVPAYNTYYLAKQKASLITWHSGAARRFYQKFLFAPGDSPFTRVILQVDPIKGKGMLAIWHRAGSGYSLAKISTRFLVLGVGMNTNERFLASGLPQTPRMPARVPAASSHRITLNVKRSPLDKLLRSLASEAQKSLVFGEEVAGTVNVNLKDMEYERAIDTILRPTKYRAEHMGDVTVIRSAKDGKAFRIFSLKNIDVNNILKSVQDIAKSGQVSIDPHTNSLFVSDQVEVLNAVEGMVEALDRSPQQVDVESAIIDIEDTENKTIGVDVSGAIHTNLGGTQLINSAATAGISTINPTDVPPQGMFVGLSWNSIQAMLALLQTKDKVNVLARPRVVALNDQEASILIGSKLGYKTTTFSATGQAIENIQFLTVGTILKIKPHITAGGDILMQISPEISDGKIDPTTSIPTETTTSSDTKVLAKDGQTIVIGGLLRTRTEKSENKVPFLGDIPIIGALFRASVDSVVKSEIMILLNPKIVTPEVASISQREGAAVIDRISGAIHLTPPPRFSPSNQRVEE